LTVISRGPILRIQIRGTCTPQMRLSREHHGAFGVGRNQAGFKAKKPSAKCQLRAALGRGTCTMAAAILTSRMAEHLPFASFIADAVAFNPTRTTRFWMHQIVEHQD
jgi:hypothetical protein